MINEVDFRDLGIFERRNDNIATHSFSNWDI